MVCCCGRCRPTKQPELLMPGLYKLFRPLIQFSLIPQITLGIIAGILLAVVSPETAKSFSILGQLFISALKVVAPILVFVLVAAAIAAHQKGQPTHIRGVLVLYVIGTLIAALRSEEHTSELQSRPHLVCRLLLEKKKK